jgi:hypothetical protein
MFFIDRHAIALQPIVKLLKQKNMVKFQLKGFDELQRKLEHLSSQKGMEELLTNRICELVPEANAVKHKFQFKHNGSNISLKIDGLSPELHAKITNALSK